VKLFLIGGFLGSGKTTAIHQAALYLKAQKNKIGVITNDQGTQQVDTKYIRSYNITAEEVAGSCFCCNYEELERSIDSLINMDQPDVVFAESVGSCTDLTATIVNPLLHFRERQFHIVLTVFADVRLLCIYLQGNKDIFYSNVNYIYEKQLEEADILVVNKIDLLNAEQLKLARQLITKEYGHKKILYQNSLSRESIKAWVNIMLESSSSYSLRKPIELDYDLYGAGEAELAWLDEEIDIYTDDKTANEAAIKFIKKVHQEIIHRGYQVGHLKFLINDGVELKKISFTSMDGPDQINEVDNSAKTGRVNILINARVQTEPEVLSDIISKSINEIETSAGCKIFIKDAISFKPGYPRPTHRLLK
jgi:G3E family GTPase